MSKEAKLVVRYIYSDMPYNWHEGYTFQIDHELPVARLSRIIDENKDPGWPMSAVGNLALVPDFINDAKDAQTPIEYLDSLADADRTIQQPIIEYAAFFPLEELRIPEAEDGTDEMSREQYVNLVERRQEVIREKVIASLGLEVESMCPCSAVPS